MTKITSMDGSVSYVGGPNSPEIPDSVKRVMGLPVESKIELDLSKIKHMQTSEKRTLNDYLKTARMTTPPKDYLEFYDHALLRAEDERKWRGFHQDFARTLKSPEDILRHQKNAKSASYSVHCWQNIAGAVKENYLEE